MCGVQPIHRRRIERRHLDHTVSHLRAEEPRLRIGQIAKIQIVQHPSQVPGFVDRSILGPREFVRTNIEGTFVLLEACRKHWGKSFDGKLFHHVSTDEVYGSLGAEGRFVETTPYSPRSPYSASKAASDHLVRAWGETYGLPVVVTNCWSSPPPCPTSSRPSRRTLSPPVGGRSASVAAESRRVTRGHDDRFRDGFHLFDRWLQMGDFPVPVHTFCLSFP